ncbi:MAG: aconitate hydratase [Candidatus Omnitrophica bacterium]|nr:aconitate hydratase [Candidatus Omnitrophota bacterium]
MRGTLTYKILKKHLDSGQLIPGKEISIKIDQTLTQDATGTMAYLQFEALGLAKVKTDISLSYVDHNTLQQGFENADDHLYLKTVAAKYGIYFSRCGNGICHQVHLERFSKPGATLLGSDSHTPTCGAVAMISIGAGGLDVAIAMGGGPFYLVAPKVIKINLINRLRHGVSAKDLILFILSIMSTKGNVNSVIEYSGNGVGTLSIPERATITNMGAEMGVTTSIFPSDSRTESFLRAQGRGKDFVALAADDDAEYDRVIEIDLSMIEAMVALPHSPGNVVKVKDIAGTKVDQVAIGSCTNSSLRDLDITAKILDGNKVNDNTSLVIAPGSKQVFSMIAKNGDLEKMIAAGARIMEVACGFCIGNGQSPQSSAVSLRTSNRNFQGRSGTISAGIYLVSPETAALSAIAGCVVDPLSVDFSRFKYIDEVSNFIIDDTLIIKPKDDALNVTIIRGPNIGSPPKNEKISDGLSGKVVIKVGDKITTDHIMPAGSRLKYRSNIEKYSEFVFEGLDPEFYLKAKALKEEAQAVFIVAGESYGQGSSREHAAICPMYLGVKAVLAKSFERIHANNLVNFGIVPLLFTDFTDYLKLNVNDQLSISGIIEKLINSSEIIVENKTQGFSFPMKTELSFRQIQIVISGGLLNFTRENK